MENATKALMMAGGVILVMLLVSLFIYAWGVFSEYYASQQDLSEISSTAEFNQQFTNYDREDVSGYELISLINKVIDYNERFSNTGTNNENYNPVTIVLYLWGGGGETELDETTVTSRLTYYGDDLELFTSNSYTQSDTNNALATVLNTITSLENNYGKENLQNLVKSVGSVFPNTNNWTGEMYTADYISQLKLSAINSFLSLTSTRYIDSSTTGYSDYQVIQNESYTVDNRFNRLQGNFKDATLKYYEYTQFKKAEFKSESSEITYDSASGRISKMVFYFTGTIE